MFFASFSSDLNNIFIRKSSFAIQRKQKDLAELGFYSVIHQLRRRTLLKLGIYIILKICET